MRRLGNDRVQMYPEDERDLYPFLFRITQEWQFLADAWTLEIPGVTASNVSTVASARDEAINLFNEWMFGLVGQQWFRVIQRCEFEKDIEIKRKGILATAGDKVLVAHHCEQVLAHTRTTDRILIDPNGDEIPIGVSEIVELQCVIAPPHNDELRVLPLGVVPAVSIFNH